MIDNKREEEQRQLDLLKKTFDNIDYIDYPTKAMLIRAIGIKEKSSLFQEDLRESIQLKFVKKCPMILSHIRGATPEVMKAAVDRDVRAVQFIANAPYEMQKEIVENNIRDAIYINDLDESIQLELIAKNYAHIQFIKDPTENVQMISVDTTIMSILFMKNPCIQAQLAVYDSNNFSEYSYDLFEYLMNNENISTIVLHKVIAKCDENQKTRLLKHKNYRSSANMIMDTFKPFLKEVNA